MPILLTTLISEGKFSLYDTFIHRSNLQNAVLYEDIK